MNARRTYLAIDWNLTGRDGTSSVLVSRYRDKVYRNRGKREVTPAIVSDRSRDADIRKLTDEDVECPEGVQGRPEGRKGVREEVEQR